MEDKQIVQLAGEGAKLDAFNQSLWSRQLGSHVAEEDDEDEVVTTAETAEVHEHQIKARGLYLQRTISRATPPDVSSSGRIFQSTHHFLMESSSPAISTRSLVSRYTSSQKPLPPVRAPSLTNWIQTVNFPSYPRPLTNSRSQKAGKSTSVLRKLMG
ncbi:movement protein [Hemisteptia virus A]|nr:movement protein [Hemisteptia virus A]